MNNKRKKIIKLILVIISLTICTSIVFSIVTRLLINNKYLPNSQTDNDWIGFWGSLFGAIIGFLVTLYGILSEREESKKDLQENAKNSVRPLLNAFHFDGSINSRMFEEAYTSDYVCEYGICKRWILTNRNNEINNQHLSKYNEIRNWFHTELLMKNIGNGPIMNLTVEINNYKTYEAINIGKDEVVKYRLYIENIALIRDREESLFQNIIVFRYKDIYNNPYRQYIKFGVQPNSNQLSEFECISSQEIQ